jgi:hypothetical protein
MEYSTAEGMNYLLMANSLPGNLKVMTNGTPSNAYCDDRKTRIIQIFAKDPNSIEEKTYSIMKKCLCCVVIKTLCRERKRKVSKSIPHKTLLALQIRMTE